MGGVVIETLDVFSHIWVHVRHPSDINYAIEVERTPESRSISEGDSVLWEGSEFVYWTPRVKKKNGDPVFIDRPLRFIGYGSPRPAVSRPL